MRKVISTILIVAGICVCATPFVGRLYVKYEQDKMYENYLQELSKRNAEMGSAFDASEFERENQNVNTKQIKGVIGLIEIPKIDCKQILIEGTDAYALRYGVGHVVGTAFPGGTGNAVLAGHRNGTFGTYFSRIDELKAGDEITCEYGGQYYKYKVYESFVIEPTDVSVLENKGTERTLTLISCHPRGKTTHRLIVKAQLTE